MQYEIFAELLTKKGVRASDVAKATGINPTVFSEWKKGKSSPKSDKLQKIADYFGVSMEYLMTGEDPAARRQEPAAVKQQHYDISHFEYGIIISYRSAAPGIQDSVCKLLDIDIESAAKKGDAAI